MGDPKNSRDAICTLRQCSVLNSFTVTAAILVEIHPELSEVDCSESEASYWY